MSSANIWWGRRIIPSSETLQCKEDVCWSSSCLSGGSVRIMSQIIFFLLNVFVNFWSIFCSLSSDSWLLSPVDGLIGFMGTMIFSQWLHSLRHLDRSGHGQSFFIVEWLNIRAFSYTLLWHCWCMILCHLWYWGSRDLSYLIGLLVRTKNEFLRRSLTSK